jgi:hypothetical protein
MEEMPGPNATGLTWRETWAMRKMARANSFKSYIFGRVGSWILACLICGVGLRCLLWLEGRRKLIDSRQDIIMLLSFAFTAGAVRFGIEMFARKVDVSSALVSSTAGNIFRARLNFDKSITAELTPVAHDLTRIRFFKFGRTKCLLQLASPSSSSDLARWFRSRTEVGNVIERDP